MNALVLAACISVLPNNRFIRDESDVVEVNHLYDEQARLVLTQVIWWTWSWFDCEYRVMDWRISKSPWCLPRKKWGEDVYETRWFDRKHGVYRRVRSSLFRETWTQYDPELKDREFLEQEHRTELRKSQVKKSRFGRRVAR